jgi:catechol 2,3-dioxygenase-like lactoylglutathione lyase family enzyme
MHQQAESILEQVENGRIGRRQAVARLVALAAATFAAGPAGGAETAPGSTFRSQGLNHIALRVTDLARSRDFYRRHLGLRVTSESQQSCFLDAGANNFVALFRSSAAAMDHYCYTIEGYDAGEAVETLKRVGLAPRRVADRVYFDDPDGLEVQISGE